MSLKRQEHDEAVLDQNYIMSVVKDAESGLGVKMLMSAEYRGRDVLQRWVCTVHPYKHPQIWDTPNGMIGHADAGESGCPICRELAAEAETVSFKDLNDGAEEQEKRSDKSLNKSLTSRRARGAIGYVSR